MEKCRNGLKDAISSKAVKMGISLSSQILLANLDKFIARPSDSFRKKELKAEESLLKYLTRTCAKTSPFSFFTQLAVGEVVEEGDFTINYGGEPLSNCTLNNHLLSYFKSIFQQTKGIAECIKVRLNPTITIHDNQYLYLTNNHNVEAFQRIELNPLVGLFVDFFGEEYPDGLELGDAISKLVDGEYVDATAEELREFIDGLFSYGLLEWDFGISGIDPFWDEKLVSWLKEIRSPQNREACEIAISALEKAREFAKNYGAVEAEKRYAVLKSAFAAFKESCLQLHKLAGLPEEERLEPEERAKKDKENKEEDEQESNENETFKHQQGSYFHYRQEQFLYEDVAANVEVVMSQKEAQQILKPLRKLFPLLRPFEGLAPEMERMQAFFTEHFKDRKEVALLEFYESYYREVKVPEHKAIEQYKKDKREGKEVEPPKFKYTAEKTQKIRDEGKKVLLDFIEKNGTFKNNRLDLNCSTLEMGFEKRPNITHSMGVFIQPYYENGSYKAVLNSMFPGYGKMFSRFLHLFPKKVTEAIKKANQEYKGEAIYLENSDASYFNANLHPPLLDFEIKTPGGHNTLGPKQQIPVTDISIALVDGRLQLLRAKDKKELYIMDLGFQGNKGRSELYQLLCRFNPGEMVGVAALLEFANEKYGTEHTQPEIFLDGVLCLQRKSWTVSKEQLPDLPNHLTETEQYIEIIAWKEKLGLPDEVFVKVTNHAELEKLKAEELKEVGRDSYKPQHIDFRQLPVVCNLFKKLISKVPFNLYISDMKPSSEDMMPTENGKFVTELMMQWYE